jgi:ABC-type branched-subunit amino acid transport system substrate-binding protein
MRVQQRFLFYLFILELDCTLRTNVSSATYIDDGQRNTKRARAGDVPFSCCATAITLKRRPAAHDAIGPESFDTYKALGDSPMKTTKWALRAGLAAILMGSVGIAAAQVKIGVTVSATGPAASLGIPEKNTIALLPKEIGGKSIQYIVLDDATDTTKAVQNTHKLIDEDHVDAIISSTVTPASIAMIDVVAEAKTPMISLAASTDIIAPMDAKRKWVFKTPQNDSRWPMRSQRRCRSTA